MTPLWEWIDNLKTWEFLVLFIGVFGSMYLVVDRALQFLMRQKR